MGGFYEAYPNQCRVDGGFNQMVNKHDNELSREVEMEGYEHMAPSTMLKEAC